VAKKVGIDLVLDKQVVITGGMDLTELVINELNK
jgi:Skp family chaperone for outer membrane proteins